jgi:hypothetical protein
MPVASSSIAKDRFIHYTDRKLMTPQTISRIRERFGLPAESTFVEGDFHYRSKETPAPELV